MALFNFSPKQKEVLKEINPIPDFIKDVNKMGQGVYNTVTTGIPKITPTVTTPKTQEGATKTVNGVTSRYTNGKWTPISSSAGSPGAVTATGGGNTGGSTGGEVGGGNVSITPQTPAPAPIDQATLDALHFLGFTDDQINSMSAGDRANWAMTGTYLKKQYDLGVQQTEINAQTFNDAYQKAVNDPIIAAKYADLATTTSKDFANNLQVIATNSMLTGEQQAATMTQEQKDLQEQEAAAGRAYSGFRQQAQGKLDTSQQGIITSTRSKIEQALRESASGVEKLYGSGYAGLSNATTQYRNPLTGQVENISYQPYGGLTGTVEQSKEADILARQNEIYNTLKSPTATQ
jgi:hypothetical protein